MSPTMPHKSSSDSPSSDNAELPEPSANFREHARMQASTASACLRKLSDWVNSVSKHHAVSRSIMLFALFLRDLARLVLVFAGKMYGFMHFNLDFHRPCTADCLCSRNLPPKFRFRCLK